MKKWEYRVENSTISERWSQKRQKEEIDKMQERLNVLGSEGWEMISYESIPMTGAFTGNVKGYAYLLFFKKEVY
ncbi:DUF4177 domain-containing protein [Acidobacteriota bacterium]